jgi:membrane-associated phospholipid phosphatase
VVRVADNEVFTAQAGLVSTRATAGLTGPTCFRSTTPVRRPQVEATVDIRYGLVTSVTIEPQPTGRLRRSCLILTDITKPGGQRSRFPNRARRLGVIALLAAVCLPTAARGQAAQGPDTLALQSTHWYPDLRKEREIAISGVGAAFLAGGLLAQPNLVGVPASGFDPLEIGWSVDRDIVGNHSLRAGAMSDWTRNASLVFPVALSAALAQRGALGRRFTHHGLVYAEAMLLSQGMTWFGKATLGRARPFAYLSESTRPDHLHYDVTLERAFFSMPSGHSSSAWTGATLAMTTHLLQRPQAGWVERAGIGFLGGLLAGSTSALRVEAGQHFPSDVLVGAGIGIVSGVAVPLLHRGERGVETNAVLQMIGGGVAGALVGVLVANGY